MTTTVQYIHHECEGSFQFKSQSLRTLIAQGLCDLMETSHSTRHKIPLICTELQRQRVYVHERVRITTGPLQQQFKFIVMGHVHDECKGSIWFESGSPRAQIA